MEYRAGRAIKSALNYKNHENRTVLMSCKGRACIRDPFEKRAGWFRPRPISYKPLTNVSILPRASASSFRETA